MEELQDNYNFSCYSMKTLKNHKNLIDIFLKFSDPERKNRFCLINKN